MEGMAAGLLVSKGGTRGSADKAVLGQLGKYPRALMMASALMFILALVPNLPLLPFALLGVFLASVSLSISGKVEVERQEVRALTITVSERVQTSWIRRGFLKRRCKVPWKGEEILIRWRAACL